MKNAVKPLAEEERVTLLEYGRSMVIRVAAACQQPKSKGVEEAIMEVQKCLEETKAVSR